jgi:hypothetical protein
VAVFFAVVILGIFYTQQGKGPESAVLLFFRGLERGDARVVRAMVEAPDEPTFLGVANLFYGIVQNAPYYGVEEIHLQHNECVMTVRFLDPRGREFPMVVFLRRVREGWKVDAWNTLRMYELRWRSIG